MIAGTVKESIGSAEPITLGLPTVLSSASDASIRVKALLSVVVPFDFDGGTFRIELVIRPAD